MNNETLRLQHRRTSHSVNNEPNSGLLGGGLAEPVFQALPDDGEFHQMANSVLEMVAGIEFGDNT